MFCTPAWNAGQASEFEWISEGRVHLERLVSSAGRNRGRLAVPVSGAKKRVSPPKGNRTLIGYLSPKPLPYPNENPIVDLALNKRTTSNAAVTWCRGDALLTLERAKFPVFSVV